MIESTENLITDSNATVEQLKQWVLAFSRDRDWEQFHHPKDLGLALAIEVGEVLEYFRYRSNEEIQAVLENVELRRELSHEVADCLWLILRLADVCQIDLTTALDEKLAEAVRKYPVEQVRGRADKYTTFQNPATTSNHREGIP
ncbi:nucleotide pyrophosphohydrolase [soil metagenome]